MMHPAPFRRVDWPIVVGEDFDATVPVPRGGGAGVVSVLSAIDELKCYPDVDTVCRRAVELLRDRIGLERTALFLFTEDDGLLHGTWGTGINGETTDEHEIAFRPGDNHTTAITRAVIDQERWLLLDDVPRTFQDKGETRVLETGWIALTPLVGSGQASGLMINDGALSGASVDEAKQIQAAVFSTLLAQLLEFRQGKGGTEVPVFRARHPANVARTELVTRAVEYLRRNPSISRAELASSLGASAERIGKAFKAEMGHSISEYKNRLRLERFLCLVEHGGENLLEAALEAGFGSYAQFHRVFRLMLGTTPKKYLTGRSG